MKKFLLKRMDSRRGEAVAMFVDAATPEDALAKAPAGCWKLHREVTKGEMRATRAGVVLAPTFAVPGGRGGQNF